MRQSALLVRHAVNNVVIAHRQIAESQSHSALVARRFAQQLELPSSSSSSSSFRKIIIKVKQQIYLAIETLVANCDVDLVRQRSILIAFQREQAVLGRKRLEVLQQSIARRGVARRRRRRRRDNKRRGRQHNASQLRLVAQRVDGVADRRLDRIALQPPASVVVQLLCVTRERRVTSVSRRRAAASNSSSSSRRCRARCAQQRVERVSRRPHSTYMTTNGT